MPASIRPARTSDIDDLVAIENAVFLSDRISRRSFRALIGSSSTLLLVADDGPVLAGYCTLLFRARSRMARLYSLAAAPGTKQIGATLLTAAESAAAEHPCTKMRLEVRADNSRAIALYERSGYRLFAEVPDYYADGATALRFEKALAQAEPAGRSKAGTVIP